MKKIGSLVGIWRANAWTWAATERVRPKRSSKWFWKEKTWRWKEKGVQKIYFYCIQFCKYFFFICLRNVIVFNFASISSLIIAGLICKTIFPWLLCVYQVFSKREGLQRANEKQKQNEEKQLKLIEEHEVVILDLKEICGLIGILRNLFTDW